MIDEQLEPIAVVTVRTGERLLERRPVIDRRRPRDVVDLRLACDWIQSATSRAISRALAIRRGRLKYFARRPPSVRLARRELLVGLADRRPHSTAGTAARPARSGLRRRARDAANRRSSALHGSSSRLGATGSSRILLRSRPAPEDMAAHPIPSTRHVSIATRRAGERASPRPNVRIAARTDRHAQPRRRCGHPGFESTSVAQTPDQSSEADSSPACRNETRLAIVRQELPTQTARARPVRNPTRKRIATGKDAQTPSRKATRGRSQARAHQPWISTSCPTPQSATRPKRATKNAPMASSEGDPKHVEPVRRAVVR